MANLKEIRSRITSVGSTMQITSAMKMVSAAKLKRAQDAIVQMRPYANKLTELLENLSASLDSSDGGIYTQNREIKNVLLVTVTSNRGLCGGFNAYILKKAKTLINKEYSNANVNILSIGKKSSEHFQKNGFNMVSSHDELFGKLVFNNVAEVAEAIMKKFVVGEYDKVILVYNQFKNAATQIIMAENYLPIETAKNEEAIVGDYLFAIGFGLGAKSEDRIVDAVMRTCSAIAAGELKQMNHIRDLTTRPEDYDEIVRGKTAGPFSIACGSAAVVAGASEEVVAHLEAFGMGIGIAFQMVDDLLDLTGDVHMGKPRGTDVHEGKMTLPLIHALTMLHGESRNRIAEILADFNDSHWDELLLLLEEAGSLEYTMNLIETQLMTALDHLRSLPESPARRLMEGLAEISIGRRV